MMLIGVGLIMVVLTLIFGGNSMGFLIGSVFLVVAGIVFLLNREMLHY